VLPLLTPSGLKARLLGILDRGRRRSLGRATRLALAMLVVLIFIPAAGAVLVPRPSQYKTIEPGTVIGCARDQITGRPLVGADVDIWDGGSVRERVLTDRLGCFRTHLGAPRTGALVAYVRKGAVAGRKGITPGLYGTKLPTSIDVQRAYSVAGTLRDEGGRVVEGGKVRVVWSEVWAKGPGPDAVAISGRDGRFRFEGLLYGNYRFFVESPVGGVATESVHLDGGAALDVTIPPTMPVTGYLVDEAGRPVSGARVEEASFYNQHDRNLHGRYFDWDVTGETGAFRMVRLGRSVDAVGRDPDGQLLMAAFEDWSFRTLLAPDVAANAASPRHGVFQMRRAGTITGQAVYFDGQPAAGAHISASVVFKRERGVPGRPFYERSAYADDQGRFLVGPLPLGEVSLWARGPAGRTNTRAILHPQVRGEHDPPVEVVLSEIIPTVDPPRRREPVLTVTPTGIYLANERLDDDVIKMEEAIRNALRSAGTETLLIRGEKSALPRLGDLMSIIRRSGARNLGILRTIDGKLQ
jgi:hypothetical protein